ncbi:MAG: hypothetical protein ACYTG0_00400 [Planctomycetota bacterium]|jgi:ribonuclease HII
MREYLVGTDEAGYGPSLGPLVISATVWEVPSGVGGEDLYGILASCVAPAPERGDGKGAPRVVMADSKALYQPSGGLGRLERGLLAALALLDRRPTSWQEVWQATSGDPSDRRLSIPWYADYDPPLPLDAEVAACEEDAESLRKGLAEAGVRLVEIRSRAVFPQEFNGLLERRGSKATVLSHATLELITRVIDPLKTAPVRIVCDKHGGRNRYGPLLAAHFPEWLIRVHGESRRRSVYRFGPQDRPVEIRFQTKAESQLPTALASMASKYLRELAMRAFNAFWCRQVDGLRPTAGYPQDAKRFKEKIAHAQTELAIDDRMLWRAK